MNRLGEWWHKRLSEYATTFTMRRNAAKVLEIPDLISSLEDSEWSLSVGIIKAKRGARKDLELFRLDFFDHVIGWLMQIGIVQLEK